MNVKKIFTKYFKEVILTYALFNVENVIFLILPYFLGKAVDQLFEGILTGLFFYIMAYAFYLGMGTIRRVYDTVAFTKSTIH